MEASTPATVSACATAIQKYPQLANGSTGGDPAIPGMFSQVCQTAEFGRLLADHGVQSFALGYSGNTRTGAESVQFLFDWAGACTNATFVRLGVPSCSFTEYWSGNLSSGEVSGPFLQQGVAVCACAEVPAGGGAPGLLLAGLVAAAAAGLLGVGILRRRRSKRPPPPPPPPEPSLSGSP